MSDRRTTISGEEIEDYSIGSENLDTDKIGSNRRKWMVLTYKTDDNGQMMWVFPIEGKIFE